MTCRLAKATLPLFLVLTLLLVVLGNSSHAQSPRRVALVIGNAAYANARALPNPRHDATAIAALFRSMGFDAVEAHDLGYKAMREAIRSFANTAGTADTAVVYFAGHGLELSGENYLLPVDARLANSDDLEYEAIKLSSVLGAIGKTRRLSVVMLDACRDNPLAEKMAVQSAKRSVERGLARVEPQGDILIAYAAQAGRVAQDGDSRHSPFAQAVLQHLADPAADIRMAFGGVRDAVREATKNRQEPYLYHSLGRGTIGLLETTLQRPLPTGIPPSSPLSEPAPQALAPPRDAAAKADWDANKDSCSSDDLRRVFERHTTTPYAELARQRIQLIESRGVCAAWTPPKQVAIPKPTPPAEQPERSTQQAQPKVPPPAQPVAPAIPKAAGASCDATRNACASIRSTCMKTCRQQLADRSYGNCNWCVSNFSICVNQGSNGACQ